MLKQASTAFFQGNKNCNNLNKHGRNNMKQLNSDTTGDILSSIFVSATLGFLYGAKNDDIFLLLFTSAELDAAKIINL